MVIPHQRCSVRHYSKCHHSTVDWKKNGGWSEEADLSLELPGELRHRHASLRSWQARMDEHQIDQGRSTALWAVDVTATDDNDGKGHYSTVL